MAKKAATKKATKKAASKKGAVDSATVRMYRIGTGDCFAIKFFAGSKATFNLMIDCGAQQGEAKVFAKYVNDLKSFVGNSLDALVVTHEHTDHVLGFERCKNLFTTDFTVKETWMSWAENDNRKDVKTLKDEHGKRKMALAMAAKAYATAVENAEASVEITSAYRGAEVLSAYKHFNQSLRGFTELQMGLSATGDYIGPLKGMASVKNEITPKKNGKPVIRHFEPGDVIEDIIGLKGVRIYVLGPPKDWTTIKEETSQQKGEAYDHNKEFGKSDAFAVAVNHLADPNPPKSLFPFDEAHEIGAFAKYNDPKETWRRIDHDWLMSAGSLALRLNSGINNLSLVLAIEFIESGRVMLFPGDAEYGSWASWHKIPWKEKGRTTGPDGKPKHLTEDLLNRTVFYKVAHHLSHNGTAKRKGLEMMTHPDLAAMATLDYDVIDEGWKSTMPNQGILADLLRQTKGRLMVMRTGELLYDRRNKIELQGKIDERRSEMSASERKAFKAAHTDPKVDDLYIEYTVKG
jgi:hypothetical protein